MLIIYFRRIYCDKISKRVCLFHVFGVCAIQLNAWMRFSSCHRLTIRWSLRIVHWHCDYLVSSKSRYRMKLVIFLWEILNNFTVVTVSNIDSLDEIFNKASTANFTWIKIFQRNFLLQKNRTFAKYTEYFNKMIFVCSICFDKVVCCCSFFVEEKWQC